MPQLRRHRRRRGRRGLAPRQRKRRNLVKFIPSSDSDFALTAGNFASYVEEHREACDVPENALTVLTRAVRAYRQALAIATSRSKRTPQAITEKCLARKAAEQIVRDVANMIRGNLYVEATHKKALRLSERPKRLKKRKCPSRPPKLQFVGSGDGVAFEAGVGGGSGVHVLKFWDFEVDIAKREFGGYRRARPDGAVRLELFVDLIPPGDPGGVPKSPLDRVRAGRGWPWYLRSFTKSPIEVEYPLPGSPMLVVYWARWADSAGNVSRFSETCVARIEGWTPNEVGYALPPGGGVGMVHVEQVVRGQLPAAQSPRLEARCMIVQLPYAESLLPAADELAKHMDAPLLTSDL